MRGHIYQTTLKDNVLDSLYTIIQKRLLNMTIKIHKNNREEILPKIIYQ